MRILTFKRWKGFASLSLRWLTTLLFAATSLSGVAIATASAQGAGKVNTANSSKAETDQQEIVDGEILVKLKPSARPDIPKNFSPDATGHDSLNKLNKEIGTQKFEALLAANSPGANVKSEFAGWYKLSLPNSGKKLNAKRDEAAFKQLQHLADLYKSDPNVEFAQPNFVSHASATPNDPFYSSAYNFQGYDDLWGLKKINAGAAWDVTTGSTNVVIAVIDSGVDATHPDLTANMWRNTDGSTGWNFINNTNNAADDYGHGTFVAGVAGAVGNNGQGVVGVNWNTRIMALKFLDSTGSGSNANAAKALQWAADHGAKVINNSYGCNCVDKALQDAVGYAHDRGAVVVVAAGNGQRDASGNFLGTIDALDNAPASADQAITVGSTDHNDAKAYDSNTGPKLDVTAPGVDILSTNPASVPAGGGRFSCGTAYCIGSGTSFATPHVAGVAALLLTKDPSLTNEQIRQILRRNSVDLGAVGKDNTFGYGRLDANRAVTPAYIGGVGSGRCLDVPYSSQTNGIQIETWDCHGGANQQWAMDTSTIGAYHAIKIYGGTKCLDVPYGSSARGTIVQLWDCNGGSAQAWTYNSNDGTLRTPNNMCLDVTGGATGNGGQLEIWDCVLNSTNQEWNGGFGVAASAPYITNLRNGAVITSGTANQVLGTLGKSGNTCKVETGLGRNPTSWRLANGSCQNNATTEGILGTIDATTYDGSLYTVRLTATNSVGQTFQYSVYDVKIGAPTAGDTQPPSTPTNVTATAISSSQIRVSWTKSTDNVGVSYYRVFRSDKGYAPLTTVGGSLNNVTFTYTDSGLPANRSYSYYITAVDAAGNSSQFSAGATATTYP